MDRETAEMLSNLPEATLGAVLTVSSPQQLLGWLSHERRAPFTLSVQQYLSCARALNLEQTAVLARRCSSADVLDLIALDPRVAVSDALADNPALPIEIGGRVLLDSLTDSPRRRRRRIKTLLVNFAARGMLVELLAQQNEGRPVSARQAMSDALLARPDLLEPDEWSEIAARAGTTQMLAALVGDGTSPIVSSHIGLCNTIIGGRYGRVLGDQTLDAEQTLELLLAEIRWRSAGGRGSDLGRLRLAASNGRADIAGAAELAARTGQLPAIWKLLREQAEGAEITEAAAASAAESSDPVGSFAEYNLSVQDAVDIIASGGDGPVSLSGWRAELLVSTIMAASGQPEGWRSRLRLDSLIARGILVDDETFGLVERLESEQARDGGGAGAAALALLAALVLATPDENISPALTGSVRDLAVNHGRTAAQMPLRQPGRAWAGSAAAAGHTLLLSRLLEADPAGFFSIGSGSTSGSRGVDTHLSAAFEQALVCGRLEAARHLPEGHTAEYTSLVSGILVDHIGGRCPAGSDECTFEGPLVELAADADPAQSLALLEAAWRALLEAWVWARSSSDDLAARPALTLIAAVWENALSREEGESTLLRLLGDPGSATILTAAEETQGCRIGPNVVPAIMSAAAARRTHGAVGVLVSAASNALASGRTAEWIGQLIDSVPVRTLMSERETSAGRMLVAQVAEQRIGQDDGETWQTLLALLPEWDADLGTLIQTAHTLTEN